MTLEWLQAAAAARAFEGKASSILALTARSAAGPMENFEYGTLEGLASTLTADEDVVGVAFLDDKGKPVARSVREVASAGEEVLVKRGPVLKDERTALGSLELRLSRRAVAEERTRSLGAVLLSCALAAVGTLLLGFALARSITRPIQKALDALTSVTGSVESASAHIIPRVPPQPGPPAAHSAPYPPGERPGDGQLGRGGAKRNDDTMPWRPRASRRQ